MRLVLVALAAARLVAAADSGLDFLPADTKVVFGVRVSSIVESPIFKDAGAGPQKLGEDWLKMVAITGFDPLHDIDEVLLASPADKEQAPALLVVRGRFNLERMGAGAQRYHGVALVGDSKTGKGVLALLDATTAVAGDLPVVRAAIDRRGHGAPMEGQLAARVQSLRDRFDIWGTGERTEGFVPPTGKREELASMDRFEFGIRISKGFELGAELHARSQKEAEKLAASMEMVKMMASAQAQPAPKIDVQTKDGTVKISVMVSEEELKKLMEAQRKASVSMSRAPMTVAPMGGAPVVVTSEPSVPAAGSQSQIGGTSVFVLPGKK
jgi:hypothetical protein